MNGQVMKKLHALWRGSPSYRSNRPESMLQTWWFLTLGLRPSVSKEVIRPLVTLCFSKAVEWTVAEQRWVMPSLGSIGKWVSPLKLSLPLWFFQRVLEKAGLSKEGLLRSYVYLKGSLKDCFLLSFVIASPAQWFLFHSTIV